MDQIERIKTMSAKLRSAKEACDELDAAMNELAGALEKYGNELDNINEWLRDFEDDEAGLIPEDIDRGALSEDGIYDLLMDQKNAEDIMARLRAYLSGEAY